MRLTKSFFLHLLFFLIIEILFVLVIFREIPETNLITMIGVLHTIYRIILIIAWYIRSRQTWVIGRFLATYIPLVLHLWMHVWIWAQTIHEHTHDHDHAHEWEMLWIVIWVIVAGFFVYRWETLLHRKYHCDTHHADTHKDCHDPDCADKH